MDKKLKEKSTEFKIHVLARINEIKAGLRMPQNWLDQSSEERELRKLEALLKSLENILTPEYLEELDEF